MNAIGISLKDVLVWLFQDFLYKLYDLAENKFTLGVCAFPGLTPTTIPNGVQGVPYNASINATPPYNPPILPTPYTFTIAEALITYIGPLTPISYGNIITNSGGGTAFILSNATGNGYYVKNVTLPLTWVNPNTIVPFGLIINTLTTLPGLPSGWALTTDNEDTAFIGGTTSASSFDFVLTVVNDNPQSFFCATFAKYSGNIISSKKKKRNAFRAPLCFNPSVFPNGICPSVFDYNANGRITRLYRVGETCCYTIYPPYQKR